MDRNKHVKEYLAYYVKFPQPPRFAVLINGPWGIGKTFLLKEFLKPLEPEIRHVYVSLYGLTSLDEIDDALFRAMYPRLLGDRRVQLAGRIAKALAKNLRVDPDLKPKDVLSRANTALFVFDDLERCDVPVNRVLGYINEFVEHDGCKVVIVANEREIRGSEDYARIREKLVGKTLEIQSVFEQALEAFTARVGDESARAFLASEADEIAELYRQSELNNLRILQQTMWDFERFHQAVADKHRENDRAMTSLMRTLFGLSFELKAGRLRAEDLSGRHSAFISSLVRGRRDDEPVAPFVLAQRRYPTSDLDDGALSDETVADLLVRGIVDREKIRAELDVSLHYVTVADEPAWRTVWRAFDRTEEEFQAALAEMERAYAAREFARTGEILHVFGLRLWLSDIDVLPVTRAELVADGRQYIDDLYAAKRIEPIPAPGSDFDVRHSGYDGLGIREHETEEYRQLYAYLREKRRVAEVDRHPEQAGELLATMAADPDLFLRQVIFINSEQNLLYNVPVLAAIDPDDFATAFLKHHPARQHTVLSALESRYEQGHLDRKLAVERPWAVAVRAKLLQAAGGMSPIGRHRVQKMLEWTLDEVLGPAEAHQPQS